MRRLLITALAWGLLFGAVTARVAAAEAANKEIANISTGQDRILDAKLAGKKPRLRFKSKSGVPKTCGASGLGEKEIREAEQKRLKERQQAKSSNDNSHNGTKGGGGDDQND